MRIFIRVILLCTIQCLVFLNQNHAQCLILGADLSYVNKIEENGGIYRDKNGVQVDPFTLFSEEGANMIRLRLWHTPENIIDHCGNPISTNNLEDMLIAAARVSENKMDIMLAIHYGDYFNDPGKQQMPKAWMGLEHATLLDSIYNYPFSVIEKRIDQGSAPSIVGVGNETTWGFIDETASTNGWKWPEDAEKFNIAFEAIDEINNIYNLSIKKAIHFTVNTSKWLSGLFLQNGISNFDIIGISFYPGFSTDISLNELGNIIEQLNNQYTKDIMIFETGFVWAINGWADSYNNILNSNGSVLLNWWKKLEVVEFSIGNQHTSHLICAPNGGKVLPGKMLVFLILTTKTLHCQHLISLNIAVPVRSTKIICQN